MSTDPTGLTQGDPLFIAGDGVFHDGYLIETAYRGRLIGVESEFFTVDRDTLEPRDCMTVLEKHSRFGSRVKAEIIHEQIEICSNAFVSLRELEAQLLEDLREVVGLLDGAGAMLVPVSLLEGVNHTWSSDPRIELLHLHLGEKFRSRAGTITADQINVGAADEADAFRIFRELLSILPEIIGLGAASPFRDGEPNGTACNRMDAYDEALSAFPALTGIPPPLENVADYARFIDSQPRFRHPGTCYSYLRPMPHRGVAAEIRCLDKQVSVSDTLAFAALAKAIMVSNGDMPFSTPPSEEAMTTARRRGIVDHDRVSALLGHLARFLPADEVHYLDNLSAKIESGSTADRLLAGHERLGYRGLLRFMAEELLTEIRAT